MRYVTNTYNMNKSYNKLHWLHYRQVTCKCDTQLVLDVVVLTTSNSSLIKICRVTHKQSIIYAKTPRCCKIEDTISKQSFS